jgi:hypothetical protein
MAKGDNDHLSRACQMLEVKPGQVLSWRTDEDNIYLVVDYGIAGGKKYTLALADLPKPKAVQPQKPKPTRPLPRRGSN